MLASAVTERATCLVFRQPDREDGIRPRHLHLNADGAAVELDKPANRREAELFPRTPVGPGQAITRGFENPRAFISAAPPGASRSPAGCPSLLIAEGLKTPHRRLAARSRLRCASFSFRRTDVSKTNTNARPSSPSVPSRPFSREISSLAGVTPGFRS